MHWGRNKRSGPIREGTAPIEARDSRGGFSKTDGSKTARLHGRPKRVDTPATSGEEKDKGIGYDPGVPVSDGNSLVGEGLSDYLHWGVGGGGGGGFGSGLMVVGVVGGSAVGRVMQSAFLQNVIRVFRP